MANQKQYEEYQNLVASITVLNENSLNIITLEGFDLFVTLSAQGFECKSNTLATPLVFETLEALLTHISPEYVAAFASQLMVKMNELNQI